MSEQKKHLAGLLTVKTTRIMSTQDRILLTKFAEDTAAKLGVASAVVGPDEDVSLDQGVYLRELTAEIRNLVQINQAMLEFLVDNVLQDQGATVGQPDRYLDGPAAGDTLD